MKLIDKLFEHAGEIVKKDGQKEASADTLGLARSLHEQSRIRRGVLIEFLCAVAQDKNLTSVEDCKELLKDFAKFMLKHFPEHPTFIQVGSPGEWIEAFLERGEKHKESTYVKENQNDSDHAPY